MRNLAEMASVSPKTGATKMSRAASGGDGGMLPNLALFEGRGEALERCYGDGLGAGRLPGRLQ
jgi:hypothetical protein